MKIAVVPAFASDLDFPRMPSTVEFPSVDAVSALRAWYQGMSARDAAARYLPVALAKSKSARSVLTTVRRQLIKFARSVHREDICAVLTHPDTQRLEVGKSAIRAIEELRTAKRPEPSLTDTVSAWLNPRATRALNAVGVLTLADLTVRAVRRRQWWVGIAGFGESNAKAVERFFASHPALTEAARALVNAPTGNRIVPWEALAVLEALDGSQGAFRAPKKHCLLNSDNDLAAIEAWLRLHEALATKRSYRKEAERLVLWAIVEQNKPLSSLNTEDAIAYRAFLRSPIPALRWIGPSCSRQSPAWRPFSGKLSARSVAYSLTVISTLFRWLIAQQYVLANPFAGVKVRGAVREAAIDTSRGFTNFEWTLLRGDANFLETTSGWSEDAATRACFLLDFGLMTGLRASELVGAKLGDISTDADGNRWLRVVGKGKKSAKVALPILAYDALCRYLLARKLPITERAWDPKTSIVGVVGEDDGNGISIGRLWAILKRCFTDLAARFADDQPTLAQKLRSASPHWMRHTHATLLLEAGGDLASVRDNLRHASIATTSIYLDADDKKRARTVETAFSTHNR